MEAAKDGGPGVRLIYFLKPLCLLAVGSWEFLEYPMHSDPR